MVPSSYNGFFGAASAAAGALIGLLFVVVSFRPDDVVGANARPAARVRAASSFIGLVNAFFVALLALIPGTNLGVGACIMALVSLFSTVRLHLRRLGKLQAAIFVASLAAFAIQLFYGVDLVLRPHDKAAVTGLTFVLIASFGVALGRAWSLMEGKGSGSDGVVAGGGGRGRGGGGGAGAPAPALAPAGEP
jgi:hypothetical protein